MKTVGLFFGGLSNEAEVSVNSAENFVKYFDHKKYKLALFYWHKNGFFYRVKKIDDIKNLSEKDKVSPDKFSKIMDVAFPLTHGKYGEDGVLQSIFEWQRVKYCGCRVLASALCMDKAVFKTFMSGQKINQVAFEIIDLATFNKRKIDQILLDVKKRYDLPIFVKPANSGSSVGVTKVDNYKTLTRAIREAGKHDPKIILEKGLVNPKEIEVAVIGNDHLMIPDPGELILIKDFYNYEDKYILGQTRYSIPAKITPKQKREKKLISSCDFKVS